MIGTSEFFVGGLHVMCGKSVFLIFISLSFQLCVLICWHVQIMLVASKKPPSPENLDIAGRLYTSYLEQQDCYVKQGIAESKWALL